MSRSQFGIAIVPACPDGLAAPVGGVLPWTLDVQVGSTLMSLNTDIHDTLSWEFRSEPSESDA
jgi:hypothetical protein